MPKKKTTLAAWNKDKKYKSKEPWEKEYKRKETPKNKKYKRSFL